jgi:hypothetical protein
MGSPDDSAAETPDWLLSRLSHVPIQPPSLSDLTPLPADVSDSSADAASGRWPTLEMGLQTRVGDADYMLTAEFDPGETAVARINESVPAKLYAAATAGVGKRIAASSRWPKTTREFSVELRCVAPRLALHGLIVEFGRDGLERSITLKSSDTIKNQR